MKRKFQFCFKIKLEMAGMCPLLLSALEPHLELLLGFRTIYRHSNHFTSLKMKYMKCLMHFDICSPDFSLKGDGNSQLTCYWWDLDILFTKQITGESLSCSYDSTEFTWKKTGEHESSLFLIFWFTDAEPGVCSLLRTGQSSPNQVEVLILLTPHK